MMKKLILTALFLVGFSIPAVAQNSIENLYYSDYHGNRVQIIPDTSASLIAEAGISTYGVPQIRINPMQLKVYRLMLERLRLAMFAQILHWATL